MAYVSQEFKKKIAPEVKKILKKHGLRGTLSVRHHSTIVLKVKAGKINFGEGGYHNVNTHWWDKHFAGNKEALAFFKEIFPVLNTGNYDNSDIMTDYFCVGHYIDVMIGDWDKDYILE